MIEEEPGKETMKETRGETIKREVNMYWDETIKKMERGEKEEKGLGFRGS